MTSSAWHASRTTSQTWPLTPAPSSRWKVIVTVIAAVVGPCVAVLLGLIALIGMSDLGDDTRLGTPTLLGLAGVAIAALFSGPVLAALLLRSGTWIVGTLAFIGVGILLLPVLFGCAGL